MAEYCNWTFWEVIQRSNKYATLILTRGDSRNWKAYKAALLPHGTGELPSDSSKCPSCGKYVNGVNPYDDGETWRK